MLLILIIYVQRNKMADLLKNEKKLISEFDFSRNPDIDIDSITLGSNKKVWWICPNGHNYCQTVEKRHNRGSGCPYCSGKKVLIGFNDLQTVNPILSEEWDFDKNKGITPQSVTLHSNKKVWWRCRTCGYSWESKINDRAYGQGCPKCSKEKRIGSFRENYVLKRGVNDLPTLYWSIKIVMPRVLLRHLGWRYAPVVGMWPAVVVPSKRIALYSQE